MYCPKCGENSFENNGFKKIFCRSCGFTFFNNTAVGVGVFLKFKGKYLFAVRKKDPCKGMLDLPGGFVDPGESLEEAASRELMEEIHISVSEFSYLCSFPNIYQYKDVNYNVLDVFFESYILDADLISKIKPDDDVQDVIWLDLLKIDEDEIGFVSLKKAVAQLKKNFT